MKTLGSVGAVKTSLTKNLRFFAKIANAIDTAPVDV